MKQYLGDKKIAKYRRETGFDIIQGRVRGNRDHEVEFQLKDGSTIFYQPKTKAVRVAKE
jgi:hypothetical protein